MFRTHSHKNSNFKIRPHTLVSEEDGKQSQVIRVSIMLPSAGARVLLVKLNSFWKKLFSPCVSAQVSSDQRGTWKSAYETSCS